LIPGTWLFWSALAIGATQAAIVAVLVARNAWVDWRLRRLRARSPLLGAMFDDLGAGGSSLLQGELSRSSLLADLRTLEQWLDLVVRRGEDPAKLSPGEFEASGIVERYLRALATEKRWVRRAAAAEMLGWTGSPRAVPALLEVALDAVGEPPPVRAVALRSLERVRHPDAAPALIEALSSAETWFPPRAAAALGRIGAGAVEPLVRELTDHARPAASRRWAASILGEIGDHRAVRPLHDAIGDVDPELRARAAKALGRLRDPSSVAPLLDSLLTDPSSFVRTAVARALGSLPARETVEFLARSLSDPEWWVRLRAVESLANLGSPARDALLGALHDRDPHVAREAARGLDRIGVVGEAIESLRREGYTPEVAELLHDVGKAGSLDALLDGLRDPDPALVTQLIRVLGRVGDRRAGAALVELLARTNDAALEARVLEALRRVRAGGFDAELAPYLASPDEWVRLGCLEYYEALGSPARVPDVTALLADANPGVRRAALRLVETMRTPRLPIEAVRPSLSDPDAGVRGAAARALAALGRHDLLLAHGVAAWDGPDLDALVHGLGPGTDLASVDLAMALLPRAADRDLDRLAALVRDVARARGEEVLRHLGPRDDVAARWARAAAAVVLSGEVERMGLAALLADPDERVRRTAFPAAVYSGATAEDLTPLVAACTTDPSAAVASAAVRAVALVPGDRIERRIVAGLDSGDPEVAVDVVLALGLRGSLRADQCERLARAVPMPAVRLAATMACLHQGHEEGLPEWLAALRDEERLGILRRWRDEGHPLLAVMRSLSGRPAAPFLARLLGADSAYFAELMLLHELERSPDAATRLRCVQGLRALESRRAEVVLLSVCMMDPAPPVRSAALEFLVTRSRLPQKVGLLEHALRDPDEAVAVLAARKSEELLPEEAIPLLLRHLETGRRRFLVAVTHALARRADEHLDTILRAISARPESEPTLRALTRVLAATTATPPPDVTRSLLEHRWATVRAAACTRLAPRLGAAGAAHLLGALRDPSPAVRRAAVRLLGDARAPLGAHERERRGALQEALRDPSPRVSVAAAKALERMDAVRATAPVDGS
jgi:HEAT repeat protein